MADRRGPRTPNLAEDAQELFSALTSRAVDAAGKRVSGLTDQLTDYAKGKGAKGAALAKAGKSVAKGQSPLKATLSGGLAALKEKAGSALGGGSGGGSGGKATKVTNIVEQIDVGVPVSVAYNQWTQFQDFPKFTKKVESVSQEDDQKLEWRARILWSHRSWESTIVEQVPDERIVWRSKGAKGSVDGAVSFHELTPTLTRVVVVLEYHPQGLFEHVGNIWRAQGRRVRLELKHFERYVMTQAALHPDELEGWRGEIRGGEVVRGHGEEPGDEDEHQDTDEGYSDEAEDADQDEEDEGESAGDYEDEDEDEYEDEDAEDDEDYADEAEDEEEDEEEDEDEDEDYADEEDDEYEDEYEDEDEDYDEAEEEAEESGDERPQRTSGRRR